MTTPEFQPTPVVAARLALSIEMVTWVHAHLDGLQLAGLSSDKRKQLAASCWHVAIAMTDGILGPASMSLAQAAAASGEDVRGWSRPVRTRWPTGPRATS